MRASLVPTVLGLVLVAAGCAGPPVRVRPNADLYGGALRLTIVNDSHATVCYVHLWPAAVTEWGTDWLGPKETIRPGTIRDFGLRGTGVWHLRLVDCRHEALGEHDTIQIDAPMTLHVQHWIDGREP